MIAKCQMNGNTIRIDIGGIYCYRTFAELQDEIDAETHLGDPHGWLWALRAAMEFLRDNLSVTPEGELVASEVTA